MAFRDDSYRNPVPVPGVYNRDDQFRASIAAAAATDDARENTWADGILDDAAYDMAMAAGRLSIACDGIERLQFFRTELKMAMERYRDARSAALAALHEMEGE